MVANSYHEHGYHQPYHHPYMGTSSLLGHTSLARSYVSKFVWWNLMISLNVEYYFIKNS